MFFFHLLYHPQYTFAGLSDHLLRQVCKQRGTEIPVASKAKSLIALYKGSFQTRDQTSKVWPIRSPGLNKNVLQTGFKHLEEINSRKVLSQF